MKSNIPWSVKGIDPEAREAAKVAARRAGMTLGEWLNSLILQSGEMPEGLAEQIGSLTDQDDDMDSGEASSEHSADPDEELQHQIENLNRKLDTSERHALTVSGIDESIERLAHTIESSRRLLASGENAQKSIAELARRVERIHTRVEEVASQHRSGIEPKTLMALERAIAGVASHIEKSDRRNTELVQSVEDALSQLGTRVDGTESLAVDAVGRIDVSLDRLSGRLDTAETEQRRSAARLGERLGQIDERLSHSNIERETMLGTVERRLAGFEAKLQNTQSRIESAAAAAAARPNLPPDVMTRTEFEDLQRRLTTDLDSDTSGLKRSISAVESRLGVIVDRLDRMRKENEAQIAEAARQTDQTVQQLQAALKASEGQSGGVIGDLRSSLESLGLKVDRSNHTATETMSALEGVLRSVTRRLDVLEGRQARTGEPAPEAPEPSPVEEAESPAQSDLPKRPTWSWGVSRQQESEESERAAESEEEFITEAEEWIEPSGTKDRKAPEDRAHEFTAGTGDVIEVIEEPSDEPQDYEARETSYAEGEEPAQDHAEEGRFDVSKLEFNLEGAGESEEAGNEQGWRTDDRWREHAPRAEPTIDIVPDNDSAEPTAGTYLDQARRAAKAAGPGERVSDFNFEEETPSQARAYMIIALVVVSFIAVAAIGWFFVRPWLAESNLLNGAPQQTVQSPAAGGAPGSAAQTPKIDSRAATEASNAPATSVDESAPSESAIGPQLPGDEEAGQSAGSDVPAEADQQTENAPQAAASAAPATPQEALEAAATGGNARAQYALALDYKNGTGVDASAAQALTLMQKAADQNLAVAQRTLGVWYEQGDGVPKDIAKARAWYEKAATHGDVQAMHNLGYFYAQGLGGLKRDGKLAQKWFKAAADKGLVASQVNLAIIYSQAASYNLPSQNDQAYFWSAVAAKRDPTDKDAPRMRDTFGPLLPPDVKAKMDEAVRKWWPEPVDIAANGGFDTSPEAFEPGDHAAALSRGDLKSVQDQLNDLGFNAGTPDGQAGPQTVTAIKAFQKAYGLPQSGIADRDLLAALKAVPH